MMFALPTQKSRDHLEEQLHKLGIDTTVLYYSYGSENEFPVSSNLAKMTLFLPIAGKIEPRKFDRICTVIINFASEEPAI